MLEDNGLITRKVYNQIPPKVEYSLSELGHKFSPVLDAIEVWGSEYIDYLKDEKHIKKIKELSLKQFKTITQAKKV